MLVKTLLGADCDTDHQLLVVDIKVKLRKMKRVTLPARYDVERITNDYTVKVSNRFNALNVINMEPEEIWQMLKEAVTQITEELIPKRAQRRGIRCYQRRQSR